MVNKDIIRGLRAKLNHVRKSWVDEVPSILWAYRTTPQEATREMPFSMVYGTKAVAPMEIGVESVRIKSYGKDNAQGRALDLDLIEEKREVADSRLIRYKQRICSADNQKAKRRSFQVDEWVWKKMQPAGEVGKLEPKWKCSYQVNKKLSAGTYYLRDKIGKELTKLWNAFHLRLAHPPQQRKEVI